MLGVVGRGSEESRNELFRVMDRYDMMMESKGLEPQYIIVDFLEAKKQTNKYLIAVYEKCIKEGKPFSEIISYDYEYKEGLIY